MIKFNHSDPFFARRIKSKKGSDSIFISAETMKHALRLSDVRKSYTPAAEAHEKTLAIVKGKRGQTRFFNTHYSWIFGVRVKSI